MCLDMGAKQLLLASGVVGRIITLLLPQQCLSSRQVCFGVVLPLLDEGE